MLAGSAMQAQISLSNQSAAQPVTQNSWQIGMSGSNVIATLNNGALTISGTGQMYIDASRIPWKAQKDLITSVIIHDGVTNISSGTFADHINLRSFSIPASVATIGRSAFSNCNLTSVTIPNTVTTIEEDAFSGNSGLTKVVLEDGKTTLKFGYTGSNFFVGCPVESLHLGRNTSWYQDFGGDGNSPFKSNTKLRTVTVGNQVTSIGGAAFYGCTNLTSVTLGNSIIAIGDAAFQYTGITGITLPEGVTKIGNAAFANSELTGIKIPSTVASIGYNAFAACNRLKNVHLEESKIPLQPGDNTFSQTPIEILYIGRDLQGAWNSIPEIFSKNAKLRSVTFSDNVTAIGNNAFADCAGLTKVSIGEGITSIGGSAFQNTALTDILCKNPTPPSVGRDCFKGINKSGCKLYITSGSQTAYQTANEWQDFFIVINQASIAGNASGNTVTTASTSPSQQSIYTQSILTQSEQQPISTQSNYKLLPVVEIQDVWGAKNGGSGDGIITPIGLLKNYGNYEIPQKMIAVVISTKLSYAVRLTLNGPIYKSGDERNKTGLYLGSYKIGSLTVPETGDYDVLIGVDVGESINGSRIVWSEPKKYHILRNKVATPNSTPPPTPIQGSPASSNITYPAKDGDIITFGDIQIKGTTTASTSTKIHLRNITTDERVDLGAGTCDKCGKEISKSNSVNNPISFKIPKSKLIGGNSYRVTIETVNDKGSSTWKERIFKVEKASYATIKAPGSDGPIAYNDVTVSGSTTRAVNTLIHLRNIKTDQRIDLGSGLDKGKQISYSNTFSYTIPKSKLVAGEMYRIAIETINKDNISSWDERIFTVAKQEDVSIIISDNGGVWYDGARSCELYLPKNEAYLLYKALTRTDLAEWAVNTSTNMVTGKALDIMDKALAFDIKLSLIFKGLSLVTEAFQSNEIGSFAKALDKMDKSSVTSFIRITATGGVDHAVRKYEYIEKSKVTYSKGQFTSMSNLSGEDLKNFFFKGFIR